MSVLSKGKRKIIYFSIVVPAGLSAIGCLFIILMYLRYKHLRTLPFKMITLLSILDLINSAAFLIPTYAASDKQETCQVQGLALNFSTFAGIVWTTFMAFFLLSAMKNLKYYQQRTVYVSFLVTLGLSSIDTLIPLFAEQEKNAYGRTRGWCWIKNEYQELRFGLFFIPLFVIILLNILLYLKIKNTINEVLATENRNDDALNKIKNKLLFYPAILVICYLPYSLKAVIEIFDDPANEFVFTLVAGCFRALHGFLNSIVYGLTSEVRRTIKTSYYRTNTVAGLSLENSLLT